MSKKDLYTEEEIKSLTSKEKRFLNKVLTEVMDNIRVKILYSGPDDIQDSMVNIKRVKEIIEKLELNQNKDDEVR